MQTAKVTVYGCL